MGPHRASNQQWPRGLSALPNTCCPQGLRLQALPAFHTFCGGTSDEGQGGQSPAPGAKPSNTPLEGHRRPGPRASTVTRAHPAHPAHLGKGPGGLCLFVFFFSFCFLKWEDGCMGKGCFFLLFPISHLVGVCLALPPSPSGSVFLSFFGLHLCILSGSVSLAFSPPHPLSGGPSPPAPRVSLSVLQPAVLLGLCLGVSVPVSVSPAAPP